MATINITFDIEGIHNWPGAPEEVSYLSNLHRHTFKYEVEFNVEHDDRDLEFIMMKHHIKDTLVSAYYDKKFKLCNFHSNSCEMLAREVLVNFKASRVRVWEDNEFYGEVKDLSFQI